MSKDQTDLKNNIHPLNCILYGPPGTGKTYNTVNRALEIIDPDLMKDKDRNNKFNEDRNNKFNEYVSDGQISFVTFHQSYGYEEFIEGIRPVLSTQGNGSSGNNTNSEIRYEIKDGIFKEIAKLAGDPENKEKKFVLIIDEINRGNISKIFGELITLIEPSKRSGQSDELSVRLPYSGEKFSVPDNLYIIGTMNTADRSIALMDTALRRRFEFVEMMPDYSLLKGKDDDDNNNINLGNLLETINERITLLYDRDHQIGHSYLLDVKDENDLDNAFRNKIIPLLQEYFYDDWEKIQIVLGDHPNQNNDDKFIIATKLKIKDIIGFSYNSLEDIKYTYTIKKDEFDLRAYEKLSRAKDISDKQDKK